MESKYIACPYPTHVAVNGSGYTFVGTNCACDGCYPGYPGYCDSMVWESDEGGWSIAKCQAECSGKNG